MSNTITTTGTSKIHVTGSSETVTVSDASTAYSLGPNPHPIPEFTDLNEKRKWMLQHVAGAFRVFARQGYTEGSAGHISIRDPIDPKTFWINPLGKHFGLMKASDMVHIDEETNVIGHAYDLFYPPGSDIKDKPPRPTRVAVNKAGFAIHSTLHQSRPDIWAACHAHSVYGRAYSAFGKPLEMIHQDACMLYGTHAVYNSFGGIVLDGEEGKNIAKALGTKNNALFLQNHGILTVGNTVDEAAYLFGAMERFAKIQLIADAAENATHQVSVNASTSSDGKEHKIKKQIISDEVAKYTYENTATPDILYGEFQCDLEYETHLDDSYLK